MDKKKMTKNSLIYTAAALLAQAASILIVPVFTHNLDEATYGQYNLLITAQTLLSIFATFGIASGLTRFYNEFEDKIKLRNTAFSFAILSGTVMIGFMFLVGNLINDMVLKIYPSGGSYLTMIVASSLMLAISNIYGNCYIMSDKAFWNSSINVGRSCLMLCMSFLLIAYFKMGLFGAMLAQLVAYSTTALLLFLVNIKTFRFTLQLSLLKPMILYGFGLVPGLASGWVYTLLDRYFIKHINGWATVGIYSMGYRLGMMMDPVFIYPFKAVFTSFKYKVYKEANAVEKIKKIYDIYVFAGWYCALGFSVFAKMGILILATPNYVEAAYVVPLIVSSYVLQGLSEFYALGIHINNKPIIGSYILFFGAGINIVLNLLLIPPMGMYGAAVATIISYLAMNVFYYIIGKKLYNLGISYLNAFKAFPIAGLHYGIYFWFTQNNQAFLYELEVAIPICIVYPVVIYLVGLFPRALHKELSNRFKKAV